MVVVQSMLVRCFSLRPSRVLSVLCVKDFFAAKQETVAMESRAMTNHCDEKAR